jgi:hypothetical protein
MCSVIFQKITAQAVKILQELPLNPTLRLTNPVHTLKFCCPKNYLK